MRWFLVIWSALLPAMLAAQPSDSSFIRGADVSFTQQIEDIGGKYTEQGIQKDALDILGDHGVNYIRLRLWHTPANGYCGLTKTLAYALRVKAKGFRLLLDIHYSDVWADPSHQTKPAAWSTLTYGALKESVYTYTKNVIVAMKAQGTMPDMVQIGNEITGGMLWPDGKLTGTTTSWQQLGELVNQGIRGAKDSAGANPPRIMIHIDRGGDNAGARWFFDNLIAQGVQFDVIGLSYYPWWHGTLAQAQSNINDLATRYGRDIIIVETAYPWTSKYLNDGVGNIGVDAAKLPGGYPVTVQGQKAFLFALSHIIRSAPNSRGIGYFYWEPTYISVAPLGSAWEHLTTFDFNGEAQNSLLAFRNLDSLIPVTVTLRLNTALNPDTLKPTGLLQVRGEVFGSGSNFLPDGLLASWDTYTQLIPANTGGDYWQTQFHLLPGDSLSYKLWTGHDLTHPTYLRLGWEGPVTSADTAGMNTRLVVAGIHDTTVAVAYFNPSMATVVQNWTPFSPKKDSIGILFRVSMVDAMLKGTFDPTVHGPVTVRGDSVESHGVLSRTTGKVVLQQEALSVAGGSFWSGVAYFPASLIARGTSLHYKFFVEKSTFGGNEAAISDRVFPFPATDTTLAWRWFNDRNSLTDVAAHASDIPLTVRLEQNYPNPFNPTTTIRYTVTMRSHVTVTISDVLGHVVRTLVDANRESGTHVVVWDGRTGAGLQAASGVYFVKLSAGETVALRKMVLIR